MNSDRPRTVGLLTADPSRTLVRTAVDAGIDFLVLDAEQTGLRSLDCVTVAEALRGSGTRLAIRVPDIAPTTLVEFANTGVSEIVLPQVRSVAQLRTASAAVRYEPEGTRSRQPSFASSFGMRFTAPPRLSVLFETASAFDSIEEFVTDPGFEGGWVGPTDLAADLRRVGSDVDLEHAVDTLVAAIARSGHPVGLPASSVEGVDAAFARGATECAVYWERQLSSVMTGLAARPALHDHQERTTT